MGNSWKIAEKRDIRPKIRRVQARRQPVESLSDFEMDEVVLHELSNPLMILPDLETDIHVHDLSDSEIHASIEPESSPQDAVVTRHWDGDAVDSKRGPNLRRRLRRLRNNLRRGRTIIKDRVMTLSVRLERTLTHMHHHGSRRERE